MNKKTDYPDLERLPDTNFWKHLFWFWWNRPRIFAEDIYEKYFLKAKRDKENAEYNRIMMEMNKEKEELIRIMNESELLKKIQRLEVELSELKKSKV